MWSDEQYHSDRHLFTSTNATDPVDRIRRTWSCKKDELNKDSNNENDSKPNNLANFDSDGVISLKLLCDDSEKPDVMAHLVNNGPIAKFSSSQPEKVSSFGCVFLFCFSFCIQCMMCCNQSFTNRISCNYDTCAVETSCQRENNDDQPCPLVDNLKHNICHEWLTSQNGQTMYAQLKSCSGSEKYCPGDVVYNNDVQDNVPVITNKEKVNFVSDKLPGSDIQFVAYALNMCNYNPVENQWTLYQCSNDGQNIIKTVS